MDTSGISDPKLKMVLAKGNPGEIARHLDEQHVSRSDLDKALLSVAMEGAAGLIRSLLNKGADVDARDNSEWTPLMRAAALGHDRESIRVLLTAGARIDAQNDYGRTALIEAAHSGDLEVLDELIRQGSNLNVLPTQVGGPAIVEAAWSNRPKCVVRLALAGADPNERGKRENGALIQMSGRGHLEAVKVLIEKGADVNQPFDCGTTALIEAAGSGHKRVVEALLHAGAAVDGIARDGTTALLRAAGCYEDAPEVVDLLLRWGADAGKKDHAGRGTLDWAVHGKNTGVIELLKERRQGHPLPRQRLSSVFLNAVISGDLATVKKVLELGEVDVNFLSPGRQASALMSAVELVKAAIVHLLVDLGADVNLTDELGLNAFHRAVETGDIPMMETLIEAGADPFSTTRNGTDAMMLASGSSKLRYRRRSVEILEWTLDKKFSVHSTDQSGKTALMYAIDVRSVDIIKFLIERGADVHAQTKGGLTALVMAARADYDNDRYSPPTSAKDDPIGSIIDALLTAGADPTAGDPPHEALRWAVALRPFNTVKRLVEAGADGNDPNVCSRALSGFSREEPRIARLLIQMGADVNTRGLNGRTPLMAVASAYRNTKRTIQALTRAGAEVDTRDQHGATALMLAARTGFVDKVEILIKKGADPSLRDQSGKTALDYATEGYRNEAVCEALSAVSKRAVTKKRNRTM